MALHKSILALLVVVVSFVSASEGCKGVTIVSRSQWKSSRQLNLPRIRLPVPRVFIHHTTGAACTTTSQCSGTVRSIQSYHVNKNKWSDIGYNFLVGGDGKVYEGRGWDRVGAHTYGYNNDIAISFIGTYTSRLPSKKMIVAAKNLIACGIGRGAIQKNYGLYGHRDASCTACPGNALYSNIKTWPRFHAKGKLIKKC